MEREQEPMFFKRASDRRKYIPIEVLSNALCILLIFAGVGWGVTLHNNIKETQRLQTQVIDSITSVQTNTTNLKNTFDESLNLLNTSIDARLSAMQKMVDLMCSSNPISDSKLKYSSYTANKIEVIKPTKKKKKIIKNSSNFAFLTDTAS